MNWVFENRASAILCNILLGLRDTGIYFVLPANVCPIVPATFEKARVNYGFVDIDPDNLYMNIEAVETMRRQHQRLGLLFVRTLGIMDDSIDAYFKYLKEQDEAILIIDDRCACRIDFEDSLSEFVDVTLFSTGYAKYVELGFGGCAAISPSFNYQSTILSYDEAHEKQVNDSLNQVSKTNRLLNYQELNWLDTQQPATAFTDYKQSVLKQREEVDAQKVLINNIYRNSIVADVVPAIPMDTWRFNIFVNEKERLLKSIFQAGLFASSHYADVSYAFKRQSSPVARQVHAKIINLFNDFRFTPDKANQIVELVNEHVKQFG